MNRTRTNRFAQIWAVCMLIGLLGCRQQADQAVSVDSNSKPEVSIVDQTTPTDQQKERMLAAKEALFQQLSGRLAEAMGSQGPAAAITVCQQEAPSIAKAVGKEKGLLIGRTGVRLRNQNNAPPKWAKPLVEAKTATPTFVNLTNGHAAALLPIKLQTQCLMCHGPSDQIAPVIQDQLAKLYPNDEATGFQEGDLRGWFWIDMPGGP